MSRLTNRREFLALAGAPALLRAAGPESYFAQFPNMMLASLAGGLNELAAHWDAERARITTPAAMETRNRFVREKVHAMLNGPSIHGPLNAKVTRTLERDGYRIENVMYQSLPDFWVTANLYVPTDRPGPFPGIISPCGHYELSRMYPDYQYAYQNLVRSGFVVLAYDPTGQGERRQYWNSRTNQSDSGLRSVDEHSLSGQLLLLLGENLTEYLVRDGMRGIDYLLTRPEVDQQRIGCAGHSGGGTLTMFISAIEERVKCTVINEGGTFHRWPLQLAPGGRVPISDAEQNLFPAAIYGIDACDLHIATAPRPLLVLIEHYAPAFNETAAHIRARYELLGAGDKFATEEANARHAWTDKLRIATTDWLCRWFYGKPGPSAEPPLRLEKPEDLYCTPSGSLREASMGENVFSEIRKKGAALPPERKLTPREIRHVLRCPESNVALGPRVLERSEVEGYRLEKVEFLSEPGIYLPSLLLTPVVSKAEAPILFLDEEGKDAAMQSGVLAALARGGHTVLAVDVRGIGATAPARPASPPKPANEFGQVFDTESAAAYMAWYMDKCLFGMRVFDAMRSVDYLVSRVGTNAAPVSVIGKGMGALWAQAAVAIDRRIGAVAAHGGLLSYRALTQTDRYVHGANIFVRDVLRYFDFPQLAACAAPRPLAVISPVDAMKRPVAQTAIEAEYAPARAAYRKAGAAARFRVLTPAAVTAEVYRETLRR